MEPESGNQICGFDPIPIGKYHNSAISPDRKTLAIAIFPSNNTPNGALHLIDLESWSIKRTTVEFSNWVWQMAFSPDGKRLAVGYAGPPQGIHEMPEDYRLVVVDEDKGDVVAERSFEISFKFVAFMPDGKSLAVYGTPVTMMNLQGGDPRTILLNGETLETIWEAVLTGLIDGQVEEIEKNGMKSYSYWNPGLVFSPQKQSLYLVHADLERLTVVDYGQRKMTTLEIHPAASWFERFLSWMAGVARAKTLDGTQKIALLSPEGDKLYVVGRTGDTTLDANGEQQFEEKALGLQVISPENGAEVAHIDTEAIEIALSPDGEQLYLRGWANKPWTEVLDAKSLKPIKHLTGRYLIPGQRLDGTPVLLSRTDHESGYTTLALMDPATFEEIARWTAKDYANWLTSR